MVTTTQTPYRECRVCKDPKPLDEVHYRLFSAVSRRFATACLACEIELAARRGETLPLKPIEPIIPRQSDQLPVGGKMHSYAGHSKAEEQIINNNPTGRNQFTQDGAMTTFQQRTSRLWREAIEAVAERHGTDSKRYDHECDLLWRAVPHNDDWQIEGRHKAFQNFALGVIGGGK